MLPLIRDSALWTMGSDSADIDWEAAWKRRIHQLPGNHKGSGTHAPPPPWGGHVSVDVNTCSESCTGACRI